MIYLYKNTIIINQFLIENTKKNKRKSINEKKIKFEKAIYCYNFYVEKSVRKLLTRQKNETTCCQQQQQLQKKFLLLF